MVKTHPQFSVSFPLPGKHQADARGARARARFALALGRPAATGATLASRAGSPYPLTSTTINSAASIQRQGAEEW